MTLTAAAVLVPLAVACGSERAGSGSVTAQEPVTGVDWSVDSVTADGATHRAPAAAHVRIDNGTARGNYGCNQFSAKATVRGDRIRLSDARSTRMACERERMAFENTLARTLTTGTLIAVTDGDRLTLTAHDGDRVRLTRAPD
ncbi:META domain-containing protein [Streptomyces sp. NPDC051636]|uniref:META domain-containing protein n=1 Tax=Streptomyces sp. NPDC051636 TaxID=3365663 RepID=UPI003795BB0A